MSYKVLYRKYRPNTFNDIVDQHFITDTLKEQVINNKISHAYIFSGPKGTGKTSTAKVFAKAINCENPINGEPCCKCESCLSFESNPDIIELDAASNNRVEDMREIINSVKLSPTSSKFKIYIIDEAHMLTNSASNAFLLTLEEPPSHVIFILATTNPESLPLTILSRCQQFAFSKITKKALIERIKFVLNNENIQLSDDIIEEIASLSDGGLRDALSMLDQLITLNKPITIDLLTTEFGIVSDLSINELIEAIINNNFEKIYSIFNKFDEYGVSEKSFQNKFISLVTSKLIILKQNDSDDIIIQLKNIVMEILKLDYNRSTQNYFDIVKIIIVSNLSKSENKNVEFVVKNISQEINVLENDEKPKILENLEENINKNDKLPEKKNDLELSTIIIEVDNQEKKSIEDINNDVDFSKIIPIRINNSFAGASKNLKNEFIDLYKQEISKLKGKHDDLYSLLLDTDIGVVSPTNAVITTESEASAEILNKSSDKISGELDIKQVLVFVSNNNWKKETEKFVQNKNKVKYEYIEEPIISKNDEIIDMAEDIFDTDKIIVEE